MSQSQSTNMFACYSYNSSLQFEINMRVLLQDFVDGLKAKVCLNSKLYDLILPK